MQNSLRSDSCIFAPVLSRFLRAKSFYASCKRNPGNPFFRADLPAPSLPPGLDIPKADSQKLPFIVRRGKLRLDTEGLL